MSQDKFLLGFFVPLEVSNTGVRWRPDRLPVASGQVTLRKADQMHHAAEKPVQCLSLSLTRVDSAFLKARSQETLIGLKRLVI